MKITASGNIRISRKDWEDIGKKAGWMDRPMRPEEQVSARGPHCEDCGIYLTDLHECKECGYVDDQGQIAEQKMTVCPECGSSDIASGVSKLREDHDEDGKSYYCGICGKRAKWV
jgi:hypothetical protein